MAGEESPLGGDAVTAEPRKQRRSVWWYVLIVIAGVVVGLALWSALPVGGQTGTVAVVPIEGSIDGSSAVAYGTALERARADPSIHAVVLLTNSPGGAASASESMYLQTKRVAESMPVVASVHAQAASGAYYAIVPSDAIFVKPSSLVGSIGVLFTPPPELEPTDEIITTGDDKLSGADLRSWYYKTESLQAAFLSAVVSSRGDALNASRERLGSGEVFTGARSVQLGLADTIGGTRAAIERAAALADLESYDVEVIRPDESPRFVTRSNYLASNATNKTMASPEYLLGSPDTRFPNYLMIPPSIVEAALVRGGGRNTTQEVANASG